MGCSASVVSVRVRELGEDVGAHLGVRHDTREEQLGIADDGGRADVGILLLEAVCEEAADHIGLRVVMQTREHMFLRPTNWDGKRAHSEALGGAKGDAVQHKKVVQGLQQLGLELASRLLDLFRKQSESVLG